MSTFVQPRFDANQQFQLDAIASIVDLFAGAESESAEALDAELAFEAQLTGFAEPVYGNRLTLSAESMQKNLRRVQADRLIPPRMQRDFSDQETPNDFAVEMETGTGKTYVYLRTIVELHQRYGFSKFVIVVPRPAILETVMWSLDALKEHLRTEYDGIEYQHTAYDSRKVAQVRSFATAPSLQIMVINIDAFNSSVNLMNRPSESVGYYRPIEFLQACNPIVIMDEPQSLDGPTHVQAVASLNPLAKVRYSATHKREPGTGRYLQHLAFRLTPVDAYDLKLVKHISVLSVTQDQDLNDPYIEIRRITGTPSGVTATAIVHKSGAVETAATQVTLKKDLDLRDVTGRDIYSGWVVEHIHADTGLVEFANGQHIRVTRSNAVTAADQTQRLMLRQAIEAHLEKEAELLLRTRYRTLPASMKPLTLFFVDEVDSYYKPDGKLRLWFEEEYGRLVVDGRYRHVPMPDVSVVHDGYFGIDSKGSPTRSQREDGEGARRAYEKILRDKGALLSPEEPLRFIFSHSALAEGWDNPNVFVICNFQSGRSEIRRRQQVGRGLRLPVMSNGERCHDEAINQLTVIANESFSAFADGLQREIEQDTGEKFENRVRDARNRVDIAFKPEVLENPEFKALWSAISAKTTYRVDFDSESVIASAIERVDQMRPIEPVMFRVSRADVEMSKWGVSAADSFDLAAERLEGARRIPDIVREITRRVRISRATVVKILNGCARLTDARVNPSVFIDQVVEAVNDALYQQVAKGIVYTRTGEAWDASAFESRHQKQTVSPWVVEVGKSITDRLALDSGIEEQFATYLDKSSEIKLFLKLPAWYQIETPVGNYNPDWALVREIEGGVQLFLVRETKGTSDAEKLQWEHEAFKVSFGKAHFNALDVDYAFGATPAELIEPADPSRFLDPLDLLDDLKS